MEKSFNYVYLTTNLVNGKEYVGDHSTNNLNDNYLGSGNILKESFKKYGKQNFKREILEEFETKEAAFNAQEKYIIKYDTLIPNGYNLSPKGGHNVKNCIGEETKKKISKSHLGQQLSEKTKNKIAQSMCGKKFGSCSEKRKENIRKTQIGKFVSKETCEKISNANRNRKYEKRSQLFKEEHSKRMKEYYAKNPYIPHVSHKRSEEFKEKHSIRMKEYYKNKKAL